MKLYSIFPSIDGEVNYYGQGSLTTFVRFAGCNLRCGYCDTKYANSEDKGKEKTVNEIINLIEKIGIKKVTITGGEPLIQNRKEMQDLIEKLQDKEYKITIETNGSIDNYLMPYIPYECNLVVDYKLPSSGMEKSMKKNLFYNLTHCDFVKFVIGTVEDFNAANRKMNEFKENGCLAKFAFAPNHDTLIPKELIKWMMECKMQDVILNIQLHKYLDLKEDK